MQDFTDEGERKRVYDPEVEALINAILAHSRSCLIYTIRVGDEAAWNATGARPPVKGVHNDDNPESAPRRLRASWARRTRNGGSTSATPSSRSGGRSAAMS